MLSRIPNSTILWSLWSLWSCNDWCSCAYVHHRKLYFVCNIRPTDFSIDALTSTEQQFSISTSIWYPQKVITPVSFSSLLETLASQLSSSPDLLCSRTLAGLLQAWGKHSAFPYGFPTYLHSQGEQYTAIKLLHVSHTSKHYIFSFLRGKVPFQETKRNKQVLIILSKKTFSNSLPMLLIIS